MIQKQKSILVVDDDEDMLKLLNKILSGAGFKVLLAPNPEVGRKMLTEELPHVIITDLHMEPEDGFSFVQSIKGIKAFTKIPILVLSALNDFNSVKKAMTLGVADYVIKPLQAAMLLRKIKKSLLNKDFAHWDLPAGKEIILQGEFEALVTALGESGYSLAGPFKISAQKEIKPHIPEFGQMSLENCVHKASAFPQTYQKGLFINDVTFVGISEKELSKIRLFVNKRSST